VVCNCWYFQQSTFAAADGPVDALWFKHEAMVLSGTDSASVLC
jgi:hypothetical protein